MYHSMQEIQIFKKDLILIDCSNKSNSCVLLNNGNYIQCHYFIKNEKNNFKIIGNVLKVMTFTKVISRTHPINIYKNCSRKRNYATYSLPGRINCSKGIYISSGSQELFCAANPYIYTL